jgi:glycerol-3-phosphate acyltransferase PlsY
MDAGLLFRFFVVTVLSYLIGSIPTGYIVAKGKGVDIFKVGSGNMGATNIVRIRGMGWGIFVWLFDSCKAIIAIVIAWQILPNDIILATVVAGLAAIVGHNWSLFVGLITGTIRGGKGASTAFGALIIIAPIYLIAIILIIGGVIIARTRYVSLAVLIMFPIAALGMIYLTTQQIIPWQYAVFTVVIVGLIFYRFRDNIRRLQMGTERRLGDPA